MHDLKTPEDRTVLTAPLTMTPTGQIYVRADDLHLVRLTHLMSALDEWTPSISATAAIASELTGYTEWLSTAEPTVTIGWDWQLVTNGTQLTLIRVSPPRTNLIIQDSTGKHIGQQSEDLILGKWVDEIDWQNNTMDEITRRYSA